MRKTGGLFLALWIPWMVSGQFTVNGSAQNLDGDCVQVTPATNGQQGAAWYDTQLDVSLPFCLHLSVNLGISNGGADGMALVFHQLGPNQPTTTTGGNVGYGNFDGATNSFIAPTFDPSIVIEFDTWNNPNFGDPSYDHVALQRDGTNNHNDPNCLAGPIQADAGDADIEDGQDHTAHVEWNPSTQLLRLEFDGVERFNTSVDLVNDVFAGNSMVWWGFTGSTGGYNNNQSFCLLDVTNGEGIPGLTLNPAPPYAVCPGETTNVTASAAGYTLTWTGLNNASFDAPPGDHTVQTQSPGCPLTEIVTVDALPGPELMTAPQITVCDGVPVVLTATSAAGATVDWNGTGNTSISVSSAGQETVTGTLGTCIETETVTVLAQNSPTLTLDATNDIELCDGESLTVTASTDIPASVQWTNNATGAVTAGPTLTVSNTGSHIVEAESGGCEGTPELIVVDILPLPTASLQSVPNALCWGETGLVTAIPNSGSSVDSWVLPAGTPQVNQAGPGVYTANLLGANGCTNTASYILEEWPPIVFSLEGPDGACDGETVELSVTGSFDGAVWSNGSTGNTLTLENTDGEGPFSVTVSLGGCDASEAKSVEWWPVPSTAALADTVTRCVLDPAVVWTWPAQAEPAVGWWVWSVDGITTTSSTLWEAEGDFTVRILDSMTGCADSTQVHVNVLPNLDVDAAPFAGIVCWDATTEIQAEIRAVEGTDIDELPYTWAWDDPDVEGLNPTVGAGVYLLEAENACGRDVALVEVTQEYCGCDMWMPNAFTPDNDGINDGLKLETNCPELDEFRLEIYNRWGQLVWITEDPERIWMGQSETLNSEGLHFAPDGVYGYRVYWKYGELGVPIVEERTGHLQLLR